MSTDVPGVLLEPGECDSGLKPSFFVELADCAVTLNAPCRDELDRMVLPVGVEVIEMAAESQQLYVRTSEADLGGQDRFAPELRIFPSAPNGERLIQGNWNHGFFAIESGCTPECGDWLSAVPFYANEPNAQTGQQEAGYNLLSVAPLDDLVLWSRRTASGSGIGIFEPSPSGAFTTSYVPEEDVIGLVHDSGFALMALESGTLLRLSLPDFAETGRMDAQATKAPGQGALLRRGDGGAYLFAQTPEGRTEMKVLDGWNLIAGETGIDVSDATAFTEEFREIFLATSTTVELVTGGEIDAWARIVMATTTESGSIAALAYDEPFLYVASRGKLPSSGLERFVIQIMSISRCSDGIR